MNSITDNIDKESMIAEIKLVLNSDIKNENVIIVVEGSDDEKFWRGMCFRMDNIWLSQSYSGKIGAIDIIQNYVNEKRVIAILDRDYDEDEVNNKIFYYDYNCLEMMLASSKKTFENIFIEYIYPDELTSEEFKKHMLEQLKYISLLRKTNQVRKLGIDFNKISINSLFKNNNINVEELKKIVNQRNNNFLKNNRDIEESIDNEYMQELKMSQLLNITNGHDFCDIIAASARLHNRKSVSGDIIESILRCSYRKEDFCKTKLFKKLKKYKKENKILII